MSYGKIAEDAIKGLLVLSALMSVAGIAVGCAIGNLAGRAISRRQNDEQDKKTADIAKQKLDEVQDQEEVSSEPQQANEHQPQKITKTSNITAGFTVLGTILGGSIGIAMSGALLHKYMPKIRF